MSKYPYIVYEGSLKEDQPCDCCEKKATNFIRWAFDYMRGNDDVHHYCSRHYQMAHNQEDRMWAHMRTKEKFLSEKNKKETEKEKV